MHSPISARAPEGTLRLARSSRFALKTPARLALRLTALLALAACHNDESGVGSADSGAGQHDARGGAAALDAGGGAPGLDAGNGATGLDAGRDAARQATAGDAAADAAEPWDLETSIKGVISDYDEQVRTNCPCFVQMGAYPSVEECVKWQGSGPDWVSCATQFLAAHNTPNARAIFSCYQEHTRAGTKCLAMTACDANERAKCPGASLECFQTDPSIGLMLATACPDISLLPRL